MKFLFQWLLGGGAAQVGETVERVSGTFRPNAEATAARDHSLDQAALEQYAAEFRALQQRSWFDALVDGLNRLVRPMITLTVLGVIPAVMLRPEQMAVAFAALALLPTGYWALVSVIIGFYFGGRMQLKAQDFERSVQAAVSRAPKVIKSIESLRELRHNSPGAADTGMDANLASFTVRAQGAPASHNANRAVDAWRNIEAL